MTAARALAVVASILASACGIPGLGSPIPDCDEGEKLVSHALHPSDSTYKVSIGDDGSIDLNGFHLPSCAAYCARSDAIYETSFGELLSCSIESGQSSPAGDYHYEGRTWVTCRYHGVSCTRGKTEPVIVVDGPDPR